MREPANKRLITDVSGLAPTVARSSQKQLLTRFWRGSLVACPRVDNGHKSIPDWRASSQGLAATLSKQQQNVAACENAHEQSGFRRLLRGRRRLAEIRSALPRPPQRLGSSNHGLAIAPQR